MSLNREGKTYRHRTNDAMIVVVKTVRMSAGTARHTILVLDPGNAVDGKTGKPRVAGSTIEVDEVPVQKWDRDWEEA